MLSDPTSAGVARAWGNVKIKNKKKQQQSLSVFSTAVAVTTCAETWVTALMTAGE